MRTLFFYLAPVAAIVSAAYLAAINVCGWGWFLLIALLLYPKSDLK